MVYSPHQPTAGCWEADMANKSNKSKKSKKSEVVVAYKGFDDNLACRGFQYEIGKEYVHDGEVAACSGGFHACEHPLAVPRRYEPERVR